MRVLFLKIGTESDWAEIRVANTMKRNGASCVSAHSAEITEAVQTTATAG